MLTLYQAVFFPTDLQILPGGNHQILHAILLNFCTVCFLVKAKNQDMGGVGFLGTTLYNVSRVHQPGWLSYQQAMKQIVKHPFLWREV